MQPIKDFLYFILLIPLNLFWSYLETHQIKIEKDTMEKRQPEFTIDNGQRRRVSDINIKVNHGQ